MVTEATHTCRTATGLTALWIEEVKALVCNLFTRMKLDEDTHVVVRKLHQMDRGLFCRPLGYVPRKKFVVYLCVLDEVIPASDETSLWHVSHCNFDVGIRSSGIGHKGVDTIQSACSVAVEPAHVVKAEHEENEVCRCRLQDSLDQTFVNSNSSA